MKTKFIGLEGYREIEDLSTSKNRSNKAQLTISKKTIRFIKRLFKKALKKASRKISGFSFKKIGEGITVATAVVICTADKLASCFKNIFKSDKAKVFLKKKAVLSAVSCMVTVTISCVTMAGVIDGAAVSEEKPLETTAVVEITEATDNTNLYEQGTYLNQLEEDTTNYLANLTEPTVNDGLAGSSLNCVALYIDGEYIGAVVEDDAMGLYKALDKVLVDYRKDYDEATTTEYVSNVEVKSYKADEGEIKDLDSLMDIANSKFSIALSTDIVYTQEIPHGTKVEYNDDEYISYNKVKSKGKNGKEEVVIRVTYVDGVQTEANQTAVNVIEEAVDEVVIKGTRESVTTGSFDWPVPYTHAISSPFGPRWGRNHNGIDIADSGIYGQTIVASDGGTVVEAGWSNGGYGNYVVIDHGNGYRTLYAHCSSVAVSAGQVVSKGQAVGYIGSTGNSTGPHLHFEIQENGTPVNPLNYVS